MRLKCIKYSEWQGTPQEWTIDGLSLGARNLVVGKNASGKTRALNVIYGLARELAGLQRPPLSGEYDVEFSEGEKAVRYELKYQEEQVVAEKLTIGGRVLLDRRSGGQGEIWAEEVQRGQMLRFQTPPSELAAVARRDTIQHKFLEPLFAWGSSLSLYRFGTPLGKDHLAVLLDKGGRKPDEGNPDAVVALYKRAEKEFKEAFKQAVLNDMRSLDYDVEDIGVCATGLDTRARRSARRTRRTLRKRERPARDYRPI